jgi:hypothetical protein
MLEILAIYYMCKKLGSMLRAKDRNPLALQILLPVCWFLAQLVGYVAGLIIFGQEAGGKDTGINFPAYFVSVAASAMAAGCIFLIAYIIPAQNVGQGFPVAGGTMPPPAPRNPYQNYQR